MSEPLLSFIVPVYNPPLDVFNELLDSLVAQTEPRWECVLIDDASPNSAVRDVLAERQALDARFRVLLRAANGGISAATNDGLDAATAPIIAFTDHDDLVDPDAVAVIVAHFSAHPTDGLVYTDERLVDAVGNPKATYPKPDYSPIRHLGHNYLNHITAVRRSAMGDLRVRSSFEPAQDADFGHRVIEQIHAAGGTVGHIARPLYSWRAIDASSASDASVKSGMFNSILQSITATIEREGVALEASTVYEDGRATTAVRLDPPPVADDDIEVMSISTSTTPADVNAAVANCSRRFLALRPADVVPAATTPDWMTIVASDASRPGVVAAGPTLIRPDQHILSVGRSVELGLNDPYWDHPLGGGPWGAWLVTREVSSVAPQGMVIDVADARLVPPLPTIEPALGDVAVGSVDVACADVGVIDVAVAAWCDQARQAGFSTIITPRATVALDRFRLLEPTQNARRLAGLAAAARQTRRAPTEAYVTTDPVGVRDFPSAWAIISHLIEIGQVDVVSIALENGLVANQSSTDHSPVLDLDAMGLIAQARAQGTRVCVISHRQPSVDAVEQVLEQAGADVSMIDVIATHDAATSSSPHDPAALLTGAWRRAIGRTAELDTGRVAHLGAELNDDLGTAASLGAIALLLDVAPPYHLASLPGPRLAAWLAAGGDDGGLARLRRSALVDAGDLASTPGYQLGATVLAPLVIGGYQDSIDHRVLRGLLAALAAPPGAPITSAMATFDPGDERSGHQQAARRAMSDLTEQLTSATVPWHDHAFRDALVADAIDAVEHPTPLLEALLVLLSNGAFEVAPTPVETESVTNVSMARLTRGATRRVRSLLSRH